LFIIDPQPWKTYKKKKRLSERTLENFNQIKLRPNMFREYLEKIGFKLLTTLSAVNDSGVEMTEKESKPLVVYQKVGSSLGTSSSKKK
jgi:7SK snRNA methylphosphate capping enzyme